MTLWTLLEENPPYVNPKLWNFESQKFDLIRRCSNISFLCFDALRAAKVSFWTKTSFHIHQPNKTMTILNHSVTKSACLHARRTWNVWKLRRSKGKVRWPITVQPVTRQADYRQRERRGKSDSSAPNRSTLLVPSTLRSFRSVPLGTAVAWHNAPRYRFSSS